MNIVVVAEVVVVVDVGGRQVRTAFVIPSDKTIDMNLRKPNIYNQKENIYRHLKTRGTKIPAFSVTFSKRNVFWGNF